MDRAFEFGSDFDERCGAISIAIKAIDDRRQHIGMVVRHQETGELVFVHLAWHRDLRIQGVQPEYLFISPAIPDDDARQVAAFARLVASGNVAKIPYGFSLFSDAFDLRTGAFSAGGEVIGLTCATFVLAVFDVHMGPLVDLASWPARAEDADWQRTIVEDLKRVPGITDAEVAATSSQVGNVRIRPAEVAASVALSDHPATFSQVEPISANVLTRL